MRLATIITLLGFVAGSGWSQDSDDTDSPYAAAYGTITPEEFLAHVEFLSTDALGGRDSGSEGERMAADYLVEEFERLGLAPAGTDGGWLQPFEVEEGLVAHNVVARLEGSDLAHETVVIGAHYDHVGTGAFGSLWGTRGRGKIHNGADDNASGTSAVLEVAEAFVEGGIEPRRTVLFILFSGEERGLLGSAHFVAHPTVSRDSIGAMINLDMVGRGTGEGRFSIHGRRTSPAFEGLIARTRSDLDYSVEGVGFNMPPSDNSSFYEAGIPALFFTTGPHPEYHTPDDDIERINEANGASVARFAFGCLARLATDDARPVHQIAELRPSSYLDALGWLRRELEDPDNRRLLLAEARRRLGLGNDDDLNRGFLGVELGEGLAIGRVVENSAAERAGLRSGDVLVALDGRRLVSARDLGERIGERRAGDEVSLAYRRGEREETGTIVLGRRP